MIDFGVPTLDGVAFADLGMPTVVLVVAAVGLDIAGFVTTAQPFCKFLRCFAPFEAFNTCSQLLFAPALLSDYSLNPDNRGFL